MRDRLRDLLFTAELAETAEMKMRRRQTELIREGEYVAEVEVELASGDAPWGPYLSVEDARKLDRVRLALKRGDISEALRWAEVFRLTPVTAA
jgi:hypothetical protein